MPQFFVPRKNIHHPTVVFDSSESHHLTKVLRKKIGDVVQIFDGEGLVSAVKITDLSDPHKVQAEIVSAQKLTRHDIELKIYPAILKAERFDWLIEKLTEIGVTSIHPILTERTLIHIKSPQIDLKIKRWEKIILSASKQCGRTVLPKIFSPINFTQAVDEINEKDMKLILWEGEEKNKLSDIAKNFKLSDSPPSQTTIHLFVGPEGGFAIQEVKQVTESGFISISLGENILRAETAAIAAASVILL